MIVQKMEIREPNWTCLRVTEIYFVMDVSVEWKSLCSKPKIPNTKIGTEPIVNLCNCEQILDPMLLDGVRISMVLTSR
ncbi:hypothetical protein NQ318_003876 [Aromia moschata]|uniref:Uncharacterized protein n=1 Tax=Aromia moschata TaxID=1265417 RepID=A0AAV8Z9M3_9CUCU|nr:hypothetical protein NQ318_003876 [Aromia moschata]